MGGVKVKWSLSAAKAKLRQWERQVDKDTVDSLKLYGATAARAVIKCTPPSSAKTSPATAIRKLKDRIRRDFEGEGLEPFDDNDLVWFHTNGILRARIRSTNARPSPFRVVASGTVPSVEVLRALNVGRYRVEFVRDNLGEFMRRHGDQYYMGKDGNTYRLKWKGVRHVTTMAAVRAEIARRQRLAGKLMGGWLPFANSVGAKMPAAAKKAAGRRGTVKTARSRQHTATITATNAGHYPGLQRIVNRQLPGIRKKNRNLARKRARALGKKLVK